MPSWDFIPYLCCMVLALYFTSILYCETLIFLPYFILRSIIVYGRYEASLYKILVAWSHVPNTVFRSNLKPSNPLIEITWHYVLKS